MNKINYLYNNDKDKIKFCNDFYNIILNETKFDVDVLNEEIKKIDNAWDYKKLLTSGFSDLVDFAKKTESQNIDMLNANFRSKNSKGKYHYFYTNVQRSIADFLISYKLPIRTCPYCNIDFINPFNVFVEYKNVEEFIENATCEEWQELLSESKGELVYNEIKKEKFSSLKEINGISGIGMKTLTKINILNINNVKMFRDHFTLDHFIPKGKFPFLSVSIYNLIPSCYSCNSKFKGQKNFELSDFMKSIAPSSETFCINDYLRFQLNFDTKSDRFKEKLKNIEQIEDLEVKLRNLKSNKDIDKYLDMFKLKGRYDFHKSIAYDLIDKRKRYPEKQIEGIIKLFRDNKIIVHKNDIKKDIFGIEIFESTNAPFEKYKKDIASQIGII
ncbi:hypothetical protein [Chryseobacterium sp. WLY505]|uniref:hypothetical protein n=1 Tax=Chryseobacterium sp. WLY505 TaxID=3068892 RepID=UPI002796B17C|nr:hypothetical protein [Chryseobacterium sp. WLY505]MDQ1856272.1 hypothetical protein [Chryseobacterium sp. WLY505]